MIEWIAPIVGASLLGSAHCAGMCGGIVSFAVGTERGHFAQLWAHVAYQLSRLFGYATLGATAGAAGASFNRAGKLAGLEHSATLVTGGFMILLATASLLPNFGQLALLRKPRTASSGLVIRWMGPIARLPTTARAAALGCVTALLPCGWLYGFVLAAAGTGSALRGALVLAAFWSGSVPVLVGLSSLGRAVSRALGARTPLFSSLVLLALGFANLWTHYNVPAQALSRLAESQPTGTLSAEASPPCH